MYLEGVVRMIPVLMGLLASPIKLNREYGHLGVTVSAAGLGFEPPPKRDKLD